MRRIACTRVYAFLWLPQARVDFGVEELESIQIMRPDAGQCVFSGGRDRESSCLLTR